MRRKGGSLNLSRLIDSLLWRTGMWMPLNNFLWKTVGAADVGDVIYRRTVDDLESFETQNLMSPYARESYSAQNERWKLQTETVFAIKSPVIVDGKSGTALVKGRLIRESRIDEHTFPGFRALLPGYGEQFESAYLFDSDAGNNYFHFFTDVMLSYLLFRSKVEEPLPLLIQRDVWDKPYFQALLQYPPLSNEKFVVVGNGNLRVNKLYISRAAFSIENWNRLRKYMAKLVPDTASEIQRVFINRKGVGRTIRNMNETTDVMKRNGINVVDTEFLTLHEQATLFSQATLVIGIHGAGLTNTIFCRRGTPVIELNPMYDKEKHLRPHYYWLARILGLPYQAVTNSLLTPGNDFDVDLAELQAMIDLQLPLESHP